MFIRLATGIEVDDSPALRVLPFFRVAQRFAWAAGRTQSRPSPKCFSFSGGKLELRLYSEKETSTVFHHICTYGAKACIWLDRKSVTQKREKWYTMFQTQAIIDVLSLFSIDITCSRRFSFLSLLSSSSPWFPVCSKRSPLMNPESLDDADEDEELRRKRSWPG